MTNKVINFNFPQLVASKSKHLEKYLMWGRGTGKTTFLGFDAIQLVKQMPRATFAMVGSTYSQILSRFMPAIKDGLEMFGVYEGYDYVVGSTAGKKRGFKMPFQSPETFKNVWHWSNGSIFQFVSLDHSDSGRGLNAYAIRGDEAALFDDEKLAINVKNTNRAQRAIFKKSPLLNSEVFTSSAPLTKKGRWFSNMEEKARQDPERIMFLKATAKLNMDNLRDDYFEYMRQSYSSDLIYNAEMLNIVPKEITGGFYAQLNPNIHYYTDYDNSYLDSLPLTNLKGLRFNSRQDRDIDPNQGFIISVDWGGKINTLLVMQMQDGVLKIIKEFFVKTPKILDHLFEEEFLPYYLTHKTKKIKFYYDRQGNSKTANSTMTFAQQAASILKKNNWTVSLMTVGHNPNYMDKFRLINLMLREDGRGRLPMIRINESNCPNLIVSLENAEIRDTSRGIEKDKRSERQTGVEQEHATHFSDTFDYPIFAMFSQKLSSSLRNKSDLPIETFGRVKA